MHDLGRHPPQRRGAAGEVAVPVGAVAERGHLLVALVGEEGDQADRLEELEHVAGGYRAGHN